MSFPAQKAAGEPCTHSRAYLFGLACVLTTVAIWSFVPIWAKLVLVALDPFTIASVRLSLAAMTVVLWQVVRGGQPRLWPGREWELYLSGLGLAGSYLLFTLGLDRTTASASQVLIQVESLFLVLLGALVLRERVGVLKWLGSGVALAGVVVVAWDGRPWAEVFRSEAFGGNLLILLAAGCWSVYALGQKLAVGRGGVSEGLAPILIVATVVSAPFAIAAFHPTGPFTLRLGGYLVALSVLGTAGGYGFLARGLQVLEASTVGMMIVMLPLGTIMAAHFCLGEVVTLWLGLGAVCIIGGIGLVLLSDRRRILAATLLE